MTRCSKEGPLWLACDNSVEFLYHADASKLAAVRSAVQDGKLPNKIVNEILQDNGFCLILIETVNETYGHINTSPEEAYARLLRLYYHPTIRDDVFKLRLSSFENLKPTYNDIKSTLRTAEASVRYYLSDKTHRFINASSCK